MLKKTSLFIWRSISHLLVAVLLLLFVFWSVLVSVAHSVTGSRWLLEQIAQRQKLVSYQVQSGDLIQGVRLKNFRFTGKTFYLHADNLQLSLMWTGILRKELRITGLYGQGVTLSLHGPVNPKPTQLKYINLPFKIILDEGVITQANINKRGFIIPIERLALRSSSWKNTQLSLGELEFVHPRFNTLLQGQLATEANYPIQVKGIVQADFWQKQNLKPMTIKALGDFSDLGLDVVAHDFPVALSATVNLLKPTLDYTGTLRWGRLSLPWLQEQQLSSRYGQLMLRGNKQQLALSLNADLKGKLLPQGEYRAFAETDWRKIQLLPLEARTHLGGLLRVEGEVSWQKQLSWQLATQWSRVNMAKQWPVLKSYLPSLSGVMNTQGTASASQSQLTLDAKWANQEQWQLKQHSQGWFWQWQNKQKIDAKWQNIQRNIVGLGQIDSKNGQLDYQGIPQRYTLNLAAHLHNTKIPEGHYLVQGQGSTHELAFKQAHYQGEIGNITAQGQVSWLKGLAWQAQLQLDNVKSRTWLPTWPAIISGQTHMTGQWQAQNKQLQLGNTQLQGELKALPLTVTSSQFEIDLTHLSTQQIPPFIAQQTQLTWGDNQLALEGGLYNQRWDLTVDNQLNDLQQLDTRLQGKINGAVLLNGARLRPAVTLNINAEKLAFEQKMAVEALNITGTLPELGNVTGFLQVSAHNLTAINRVIPDLAIVVEGTRDNHQLTWQMLAEPVVAEGVLRGALDEQSNWQGVTESGVVKIGDFIWELQQPFATTWLMSDKQMSLAEHCWQAEQAQLCNQKTLLANPQQVQAQIALKNLEISRLSELFPEGLAWQGDLQGQASFDWQAEQKPHFALQLVTRNGAIGLTQEDEEPLTLPYHQLSLVAKDDTDDHIAFRFEMQAPNMGQGYVDARLNPQQSPYQINGAMVLEKVNLAIFKPFFPAMRHLAGEINLAGGLAGDITRPDFYGEFSLQEGEMLAKNAPIDLTHTNIKASIRGKQASITGQLNSGQGIANLQGEMQWQTEPSLNLNLEGTQLEFAQKPLFKAKVSPQLNIKVQPYLVDIKGKALVEDAILKPQSLSEQAVPLSADVRMIDLTTTDRIKIAKAMRQWDINADIDLQLGENVFFSGFGLQSKLTGGLKLQQQKQRGMQAIGEIQLDKEAKYEAYGQKLNIRRGQILFAGSIAQPALEIEAIKEVDSKIVGVRVEGRANAPTLTLFSDTAMNQDEMLGYLLLGRPLYQDGQLSLTNNNNSNDSALLASAALSLGIKGGQGLASGIGTALGVKDVTLDAEGSGDDTRFTVSGYLTPSLYLRYGVGVFTPVNKVTLRYKLNKNLYLEAVSSLENALDLFYNFKF